MRLFPVPLRRGIDVLMAEKASLSGTINYHICLTESSDTLCKLSVLFACSLTCHAKNPSHSKEFFLFITK